MNYNVAESGKRIRELRTARNMTRQQLAERIGLTVNALSKIETGINGAKIDTLICIAELFNVSLDYLVCGRGNETESILEGLLIRTAAAHRKVSCRNIMHLCGSFTGRLTGTMTLIMTRFIHF